MSDKMKPLRILLLCDDNPSHANTVLDHIGAFQNYSQHEVTILNPMRIKYRLGLNFNSFDVLIIHYSLCIIYEYCLPVPVQQEIKAFTGLTVQFIQDEYRWVNTVVDKMLELNVDLLYSCVPDSEVPKLYGRLQKQGVTILPTLTGYVPEALTKYQVPSIAEREKDVCYRGRDIPFWLGALTREKLEIGKTFKAKSEQSDLVCDIGWTEEDRIYGESWNEFVYSAKATLGTESGASIADFDGEVETAVTNYFAQNPQATYEEVARDVLQPYEGNVVVNVISPRVFEAIALRTALVLFPGSYSSVVEAGKHFIPLQKDFSNFDEVVSLLKDDEYLQGMVDRAYEDVIGSEKYSYQSFIRAFDQQVADEFVSRFPSGRSKRVQFAGSRLFGRLIQTSFFVKSEEKRQRISLKLRNLFARMQFRRKPKVDQIKIPQSSSMAHAVKKLLWQINLFIQRLVYFSGQLAYVCKLLSLSGILFIRDSSLRKLVMLSLKGFPNVSIKASMRLLVQAARVTCARSVKVKTSGGRDERLHISPEIRGNICILKVILASDSKQASLTKDELIHAFHDGRVEEILWEKTEKVQGYPFMLHADYSCFPVLNEFAKKHPNETAELIMSSSN